MQTLLIVDRFQGVADLLSGIGQVVVLVEVDLLTLQCLHEALGFGVRVLSAAHADCDVVLFQQACVLTRSILGTAVRVMHLGFSFPQHHPQRHHHQERLQPSAKRLAQAAARMGIQYYDEIDELVPHADIGQVGESEIVGAVTSISTAGFGYTGRR